ncbi:uncharacterized protein LOC62_06G007861 [Vanrija pseudolonga]|uniref:Uncharacterized protein n=1 Tax=Vanrija pseudolonga TaxID=143232 RepID=A0AAF1BK78_9TREE|nr:hypothetical protein LOC62_06G007861 [Vanrija pseudolonga]
MAIITGPNHPVNCSAPVESGSASTHFVTVMSDCESPWMEGFTDHLEDFIHRTLDDDNITKDEFKLEWETTGDHPKGFTLRFDQYIISAEAFCRISNFMIIYLEAPVVVTMSPGLPLRRTMRFHMDCATDTNRLVIWQTCARFPCML